jgi:hypothetical protein
MTTRLLEDEQWSLVQTMVDVSYDRSTGSNNDQWQLRSLFWGEQ